MGLDNSNKSPHDLGELCLNSFYLLFIWFCVKQETLIINSAFYKPDLVVVAVSWLPMKEYFPMNINKNSVYI